MSGGLYFDEYYIRKADGTVLNQSVKIGVAQKLVNTDEVCLSLGVNGSLNYLKFDEKTISIYFTDSREGYISENI